MYNFINIITDISVQFYFLAVEEDFNLSDVIHNSTPMYEYENIVYFLMFFIDSMWHHNIV